MDIPTVPIGSFKPVLVALLVAIWFYRWLFCNLPHIPTVGGPSLPIASYIGALRLLNHGRDMVHEGYIKVCIERWRAIQFKGGIFKIAMPDQWLVIVTGASLIAELGQLPDDAASAYDALVELFELEATFGTQLKENPIHAPILRKQLSRYVETMLPSMIEEMVQAFDDLLPLQNDKWAKIPDMLTLAQNVIARVSNRAFVGYPTCRHTKFLEVVIQHTNHVAWTRKALVLCPKFLKRFAAQFAERAMNNILLGQQYLLPTIEQRISELQSNRYMRGINTDVLQWIIESALSQNMGTHAITSAISATNWVAMHTSSNVGLIWTFTHMLLDLAKYSYCTNDLREEVERVTHEKGWTKDALTNLFKLESFMRESMRMNGLSAITVVRKTRRDATFSNGVHVPSGTIIVAAARDTHMDPEYYDNPGTFDPERFYRKRAGDGKETNKESLTSCSSTNVVFGIGKHACPGRHFAALELKALMAYVITNYDIKLDNPRIRPPSRWSALAMYPCADAELWFRKRRT